MKATNDSKTADDCKPPTLESMALQSTLLAGRESAPVGDEAKYIVEHSLLIGLESAVVWDGTKYTEVIRRK